MGGLKVHAQAGRRIDLDDRTVLLAERSLDVAAQDVDPRAGHVGRHAARGKVTVRAQLDDLAGSRLNQ